MGLTELFDSRDKKKRLSHIKNLVALAASDGETAQNEIELILRIGIESGLTREELDRIISRPESITFTVPNNFRERIEQLYDMVLLMMIDGKIHKNEVALCKITAIRLGFQEQIVDNIVYDVIDVIERGIVSDIALSTLEKDYAS